MHAWQCSRREQLFLQLCFVQRLSPGALRAVQQRALILYGTAPARTALPLLHHNPTHILFQCPRNCWKKAEGGKNKTKQNPFFFFFSQTYETSSHPKFLRDNPVGLKEQKVALLEQLPNRQREQDLTIREPKMFLKLPRLQARIF